VASRPNHSASALASISASWHHSGLVETGLVAANIYSAHRDLRSFEIRLEFESAVPIRFNSDGPIRKFSNRPCMSTARSSQTTQTINGA